MTAPDNNDAALVRDEMQLKTDIIEAMCGDAAYSFDPANAALEKYVAYRLTATAERANELEQTLLRWCDERDEGIPVEDIRSLLAATAERTDELRLAYDDAVDQAASSAQAALLDDALADALRRAWGATSVRDRNMLEQVEKRLKRADEVKLVLDEAIDEVTRLKSALLVAQQELADERGRQTKREAAAYDEGHKRAEATITRLQARIDKALGYIKDPDHAPPLESLRLAVAALAQDAEQTT